MKLQITTAALLAATALVGGSAVAQDAAPATMQPIPNPPEKSMGMGHKHMMKHHMMKHHMAKKAMKSDMSKPSTDTTPAPAPQ